MRRLGRTGCPPTKALHTWAPSGRFTSRYCRALLRTDIAISVIICPSSATTVVSRTRSTKACKTSASSKRWAPSASLNPGRR